MTRVAHSGCLFIQDRSCQYADAGEHGCHLAAHGCSHHEARTIPLVAGTLSGVAMSSKSTQRKCDVVPNAFCTAISVNTFMHAVYVNDVLPPYAGAMFMPFLPCPTPIICQSMKWTDLEFMKALVVQVAKPCSLCPPGCI